MAKLESSKTNLSLPCAKIHPSIDLEADPNSYSLEKFRLYETRAVTILCFSFYVFTLLAKSWNSHNFSNRKEISLICLLLWFILASGWLFNSYWIGIFWDKRMEKNIKIRVFCIRFSSFRFTAEKGGNFEQKWRKSRY